MAAVKNSMNRLLSGVGDDRGQNFAARVRANEEDRLDGCCRNRAGGPFLIPTIEVRLHPDLTSPAWGDHVLSHGEGQLVSMV
jgi:hypothetical protein